MLFFKKHLRSHPEKLFWGAQALIAWTNHLSLTITSYLQPDQLQERRHRQRSLSSFWNADAIAAACMLTSRSAKSHVTIGSTYPQNAVVVFQTNSCSSWWLTHLNWACGCRLRLPVGPHRTPMAWSLASCFKITWSCDLANPDASLSQLLVDSLTLDGCWNGATDNCHTLRNQNRNI